MIKKNLDFDKKFCREENFDLEVVQFGDLQKGDILGKLNVEFDLKKIKEKRDEILN